MGKSRRPDRSVFTVHQGTESDTTVNLANRCSQREPVLARPAHIGGVRAVRETQQRNEKRAQSLRARRLKRCETWRNEWPESKCQSHPHHRDSARTPRGYAVSCSAGFGTILRCGMLLALFERSLDIFAAEDIPACGSKHSHLVHCILKLQEHPNRRIRKHNGRI